MNAERIDKVRRRAEAGLKNCSFDEARQFYTDVLVLLALLDEKAEKMKVGEDKAVKLTGGLTIAPVAETSPGLSEDERAMQQWLGRAGGKLAASLTDPEEFSASYTMMVRISAIVGSRLSATPAPPKNVTMGLVHDRLREVGIDVNHAVTGPAPPAPWGGPTKRCEGCGRQAADDPAFPDDYCMKCWKEQMLGFLRRACKECDDRKYGGVDCEGDTNCHDVKSAIRALIESAGAKHSGEQPAPPDVTRGSLRQLIFELGWRDTDEPFIAVWLRGLGIKVENVEDNPAPPADTGGYWDNAGQHHPASKPAPLKDYYDFSKGRRGPVVVDRPDKMIAKPAPPTPGEEERDRLDKFLITMMCHVKEAYEDNGTPWDEADEERFVAIRALILAALPDKPEKEE